MKSPLALAAIVSSLGLLGCASAPVTIPVLRPAELDVAGVRSIAVCEFQGSAPHAETARQDLSAAITRAGQCDAPPPHIVREFVPASVPYRGQAVDVRLAVEQARRAGFDAVLVGEVKIGGNAGQQFTIGNPKIDVAVETQLIDAHTGHVRGATSTRRRWQGELSRLKQAENTELKIAEALVRQCTAEAAGKLAATTIEIEVALAEAEGGDDETALDAGIAAAAAGNWPLAAQHFEHARNANSTSHAALYNLGLACEAQFNYAAARHWHAEALRLHEAEDYRAALARVDSSWRDYDLAMRQTPRNGDSFAERSAPSPFPPAGWQR